MSTTAQQKIDEFAKLVTSLEEASEHAGQAKVAYRAGSRYKDALAVLPGFEKAVEMLATELNEVASLALTETDDMKAQRQALTDMVKLGDILADMGVDVSVIEPLIARYDAALAARPTAATRAGGESSIREVGELITASCACGAFEATSPKGDWTSIRHRAKKHGEVCAIANPGQDSTLENNMTAVRDRLITLRRSPVSTGGLTFTIGS